MSELQNNLQLKAASTGVAPCSFVQFKNLVHSYLQRLIKIGEEFTNFSLLGSDGYKPIENDLSNLDAEISEAVNQKLDRSTTQNEADKMLLPTSVSRSGFVITLFALKKPTSAAGEDRVELLIRGASSVEGNGGITLIFPERFSARPDVTPYVKNVLDATLDVWSYRFASARTMSFERAIEKPGDLYSGQWLTFMPFNDLNRCLPPDIVSQPLRDGTLISVTPHLPQATNPSDVAAGKRVREALDHLGLVWHSTYAIHGWPPDEEEWRYEEAITGAPRGRKYRVRCIDFDGYDAQRNVLLYAKLFRRLRHQRKEWGLRGWDGPVLNEARRQVRAANGTQIEWHVGLEEPAARVRTLLADYTDFKEEQLRVIYTPASAALSP